MRDTHQIGKHLSEHFADMDVSVTMEPGLSSIEVRFRLQGDYKSVAKLNEKIGEIMSQDSTASDQLIAMGAALDGITG